MDFFKRLENYDIILASQSPRRKELMKAAGIPFRTMVRPTNEEFPENLEPIDVVQYLCRKKANRFNDLLDNHKTIIITADTIVVHKGCIINKPGNAKEAFEMLFKLSNSTHEVYTGVCIRNGSSEKVFHDHSLVTFRALADEEIRYYIDNFAPYDKAGAYGIQEWIGYIGINSIEGSYPNVMGMPVHKVYLHLNELTNNIL